MAAEIRQGSHQSLQWTAYMLPFVFYRVLVPLARKMRFVRANSLYHLAAFYLDKKHVSGIVDGGAFDGADSIKLARLFPEATIYAFEPAPDSFELLTQSVRRERRIRPVRLALAEQCETAMLNINSFAPTNSLLRSDEGSDAQALFHGRGTTLSSVEVEAVSLDRFLEQNPGFTCALLKLDLQGYELPALRGASQTLRTSILAVISEVRFKPLYVGDVLFHDIDSFLAMSGFRLTCVADVTSHPQTGEVYEANALWLKAKTVR